MNTYSSWGRYPHVRQRGITISDRFAPLPEQSDTILPYGNGRSYGDSCLNRDGIVVSTRWLNKLISFDATKGLITCESGVLLSDILDEVVPRGWFLAVTPGTKYVTVGGAIANDVHGKNHHRVGTFGRFLRRFELLQSDGERILCSPTENESIFQATIGGLGLTGLITWAEFQLAPIRGTGIASETIKFSSLDEFLKLSTGSAEDYEYTVAWVDCMATGKSLGRGIFTRGNHCETSVSPTRRTLSMPGTPPFSLVNRMTVSLFNKIYYHGARNQSSTSHYDPFFFPLDKIRDWNRIYGPKGFMQYQCVVPLSHGLDAMTDILGKIAESRFGSNLAVLKICGDLPSPGVLSFPMPGISIALDFPYIRDKVLSLFEDLDRVVLQAGGRIYPAKDAHMSAAMFQQTYPNWRKVEKFRDPMFMSDTWRRVSS